MGERLINCTELAEYLGVKSGTIRIWISQGRLPHIKLGASVRFSPENVSEILHKGKREPLTR